MSFRIKVRGASSSPIVAEYLCPTHGRFEATLARTPDGGAPDYAPCPDWWRPPHEEYGPCRRLLDPEWRSFSLNPSEPTEACWMEQSMPYIPGVQCGMKSPWTASAPHVKIKLASAVRQGGAEKSPHETALDTRELGEGMPLNEWRKKRAKMWAERDRKRAKKTGAADRAYQVLQRRGELID